MDTKQIIYFPPFFLTSVVQFNKFLLSPNDLNISDFDEFLGMMKNKASEADQESDLRDAFKIFDRDNNGYIDMKELKQVRKYRCKIYSNNLSFIKLCTFVRRNFCCQTKKTITNEYLRKHFLKMREICLLRKFLRNSCF